MKKTNLIKINTAILITLIVSSCSTCREEPHVKPYKNLEKPEIYDLQPPKSYKSKEE